MGSGYGYPTMRIARLLALVAILVLSADSATAEVVLTCGARRNGTSQGGPSAPENGRNPGRFHSAGPKCEITDTHRAEHRGGRRLMRLRQVRHGVTANFVAAIGCDS